MKKNKIFKGGKVLSIILLISTLIMFGLIIYANLLPSKFLIVILAPFILIDGMLCLILRKTKKRKAPIIFFIIMLIIQTIISYYLLSTIGFLSGFKHYDYKTEKYQLVVLKNSSFENIKDLEDKYIGYVDAGFKGLSEAFKKVDKEINFEKQKYNDIEKLADGLFNKEVSAILLEESQYNILGEERGEFLTLTKTLDVFESKIKVKVEQDNVDILNKPFTVYITGNDQYGSITGVSRSDVNMLVTINIEKGTALITNIPRDYYVSLDGKNAKDKLTHAGIYGIDSSIKTIENLLDIDINYYLKVNFTSVEKVVDTLGGIEVNSNYAFTSMDGTSFKKGINKLNGKQTLSFVRERHAFDSIGGDRIRGENQQLVIQALVNKALTPAILTKYSSILNSLDGNFMTDFNDKNISKIIKYQLDKNPSWQFETVSLTGTDSKEFTYSYPSKQLYVMIPDEQSIADVKLKINSYLEN
ncbi:MAG: LCP family protein [Bacilli bacterium]|nr:LCP family protein [Bacilli bacterium]